MIRSPRSVFDLSWYTMVRSPMVLMARADLAVEWECCTTIRKRFRGDMTWIQWPVNAIDAAPEELPEDADCDGKDVPRHPVCTKALELNAEALLCMLDFYDGNFVDIPTLQHEAG